MKSNNSSSPHIRTKNQQLKEKIAMPKVKINRIVINYKIVGDGPHTVLCLPGYLGNIDMDFGPFLEKADKTKFQFVCWDPPGYGKSYPPKREFTQGYLDRDANLVWELMDILGFESYYVLGWSQGGATGIILASFYPDSVLKLVTIGTEATLSESSVRFYNACKSIDFWPKENVEKHLKFYKRNYLESMTHEMAEYGVDINKFQGGEYMKNTTKCVKCPVLIVHGQEDTSMSPKNVDILKSRIPNTEVKLFPTAKHDVHLTHTEEFLEAFEKFLLHN
ncbi:unnamed protein product [Allacma fusca]|uniref:AB hydrolase-1 domain-containing protein n=1 Tax=Allacma fusca TaxID=39272 RepID=A0A8J2K0J8_9HEXA|nr:unnamed protein product [Allacma fusca]